MIVQKKKGGENEGIDLNVVMLHALERMAAVHTYRHEETNLCDDRFFSLFSISVPVAARCTNTQRKRWRGWTKSNGHVFVSDYFTEKATFHPADI